MLYIRFKPSGRLTLLLSAVHVIAIGLFLVLPLPIWLKVAAILAFCTSFAFYFERNARLAAPNSIIALETGEDCTCVIETRNGRQLDGILLPTSYVSASLTLLNLKAHGERLARHVVILPDAINSEDFRKLRVFLRWKYKPGPI
jgi:toxin CptA